jgi:hypothetical protein
MPSDADLKPLASLASAAAIISPDGSVAGKLKNFGATPAEVTDWIANFADVRQFRQQGLSYGGKKLFVCQFNDSLVVAVRDHFVVFLFKTGSKTILCAACDQSLAPEPAFTAAKALAATIK